MQNYNMAYNEQDTKREVEEFKEIVAQMVALKEKKAGDYGNSWKVFGLTGVVYQIASKFIRIWNLHNSKKIPNNEALEDSFIDIANYAIMAVQLIRSGQKGDVFSGFGEIVEKTEGS